MHLVCPRPQEELRAQLLTGGVRMEADLVTSLEQLEDANRQIASLQACAVPRRGHSRAQQHRWME